ncbi:MAG: hypothetical protein RI911_66 [Candidatus Parcubacteria bacterium]|jgi:SAM-dependent methyltransferase
MTEQLHEGFDGLVHVLKQVPKSDVLVVNVGAYDASRSFRNMFSQGSYADGKDATGVSFIEVEADLAQAKNLVGISGDGVTVVAADATKLPDAMTAAQRKVHILSLANIFSGRHVDGAGAMNEDVLRSYIDILADGGELLVFEYNEPNISRGRLATLLSSVQNSSFSQERIAAEMIEPAKDDFSKIDAELDRVGISNAQRWIFKQEWENAKRNKSVGMPYILRFRKMAAPQN